MLIFDDKLWEFTVRTVAERLRLSLHELESLQTNRTAKLIAAIPFIAGCVDADRVSLQHLTTYLLAQSAERVFDHREEDDDDLFSRLERISHFPDGDKRMIRRGMNLLALVMLNNYEESMETDRRSGVYNPLVSGVWNVEKMRRLLIKEVRAVSSPEMDAIMELEQAVGGSWN
jgi:hypothetical protein